MFQARAVNVTAGLCHRGALDANAASANTITSVIVTVSVARYIAQHPYALGFDVPTANRPSSIAQANLLLPGMSLSLL